MMGAPQSPGPRRRGNRGVVAERCNLSAPVRILFAGIFSVAFATLLAEVSIARRKNKLRSELPEQGEYAPFWTVEYRHCIQSWEVGCPSGLGQERMNEPRQ